LRAKVVGNGVTDKSKSRQMRTLIHAGLYAFGGAAWTFLALHIQEHFFWPQNLTPHQQRRLDSAKRWITLMGAIAGLLVSAYSN